MKFLTSFFIGFVIGICAGLIVKGQLLDLYLTSFLPAIATLIGAFVAAFYGAKFAFQFQKDKELEENKKRNIVNGNKAIFDLKRMTDRLMNYQKDIINPYRERETVAFIVMPATPQLDKNDIKLKIEELYFLLESDDKNLLAEICLEEERYKICLDVINLRSQFHFEAQQLLERNGIELYTNYSLDETSAALGLRLYDTLQGATKQVIENVDSAIKTHKQIIEKLRESLQRLYPDGKFIRIRFPQ